MVSLDDLHWFQRSSPLTVSPYNDGSGSIEFVISWFWDPSLKDNVVIQQVKSAKVDDGNTCFSSQILFWEEYTCSSLLIYLLSHWRLHLPGDGLDMKSKVSTFGTFIARSWSITLARLHLWRVRDQDHYSSLTPSQLLMTIHWGALTKPQLWKTQANRKEWHR